MLHRIELTNFKSWQSLDLELGNLTFLFGTNSSGKSSILQSLLLLYQTATGFDHYQAMNLGGEEQDLVDFGSYTEIIHNHDTEKSLGIKLIWKPDDTRHHYILSATDNRSDVFEIATYAYEATWEQNRDEITLDKLQYTALLNPESTVNHLPFDLVSLRVNRESSKKYTYEVIPQDTFTMHSFFQPFNESPKSCYEIPMLLTFTKENLTFAPYLFNPQFEELMKQIQYIGPLREHPRRTYSWNANRPHKLGNRGEKTIDVLLASIKYHENKRIPTIAERVSQGLAKLGIVDELILATSENQRIFEPKVRIGNTKQSLVDVGFGVSQVLPILTMLYFVPQGSIVLIEQPEIHLHPSAQAELADLFLEVAQERNLQLIIESHSEHILRRLQRRVAEAQNPLANPEHIKLYFCEMGEQGSVLNPVQMNAYGQIINYPKHFFGDISGDLDAMIVAGVERRMKELSVNE